MWLGATFPVCRKWRGNDLISSLSETKHNKMKWSEKEIAENVLREVGPLGFCKFQELFINLVVTQVNGFVVWNI